MTFDMTKGAPLRLILVFTLPLLLGNLFQQMYNLVDAVIVGKFLGLNALSSVNASASVLFLVINFVIGVCCGFAIPVAQRFGAGDERSMRRYVANAALLSAALAAVLTVATTLLCRLILQWLSTPEAIYAGAYQYLLIIFLGIPCTVLYNMSASILRALGDSRTPFLFLVVSTVVNVVLDLLFIVALGLGVSGAALATVLAQWASFVVCLVYVLRHRDLFGLVRRQISFHKDKMVQILKLGIPCAVQMTVVGLSWLAMTFLINAYGVEASAASGICAKVKDVALLVTIALYTAATTMVAQCLGAKKFDRASRVVHVAMRLSLAVTAVLILGIELLAPQILSVFHPDQGTMEIAVRNLRIEILGQIFYASFMVYNALPMGAGHTMFALGSSLLNCIVVRVILALILNHFYGLVGIFWACAIAPASSVPLGYLYERTGVWRRALVQGEES